MENILNSKNTSPKVKLDSKNFVLTSAKAKSSIAASRIKINNNGSFHIKSNNKLISFRDYFNYPYHVNQIERLFSSAAIDMSKFEIIVKLTGGGKSGQALALIKSLATAIVHMSENQFVIPLVEDGKNENIRKLYSFLGYLNRRNIVKERKKTGLRAARKRRQFSKR